MSSTQNIYKDSQQVTPPWMEVASVTKSVVIDSRQRDCNRFTTPSFYTLDLENEFKNVNSVELKGAIFPKSSYNIHSSNNKIDFVVGDFISSFKIIDKGAGYTSAPTVEISAPPGIGVTATATAFIDAYGCISNIAIGTAGSGYVPSTPPFVFLSPPQNNKQARYPKILAVVGNQYTATLRIGEYDIGGNPIPPATSPTGLVLEIQNAMNYVVNGGNYDPASTGPFVARLVNQYPSLTSNPGTPEAFNTNACLFNRIQVTETSFSSWQFLWSSGPNKIISAASVMGFNTVDSPLGIATNAVVTGLGTLIPAGTSIRGPFDYNLKNDPDYVIMTVYLNNKRMDRLKSADDGLDDTFAILLFDNNNPETLHDLSAAQTTGSIAVVDGIQYLQGATGKGNFWRDAGSVKPIKGYDFDSKKLTFKPPAPIVSNITIKFTKFGYKNGGAPLFYNMEGREHVLLFEFSATDNRSQQKQ
jgi:hypothetical protein